MNSASAAHHQKLNGDRVLRYVTRAKSRNSVRAVTPKATRRVMESSKVRSVVLRSGRAGGRAGISRTRERSPLREG
jgi:hypothetical protein